MGKETLSGWFWRISVESESMMGWDFATLIGSGLVGYVHVFSCFIPSTQIPSQNWTSLVVSRLYRYFPSWETDIAGFRGCSAYLEDSILKQHQRRCQVNPIFSEFYVDCSSIFPPHLVHFSCCPWVFRPNNCPIWSNFFIHFSTSVHISSIWGFPWPWGYPNSWVVYVMENPI